MQLEVKIDAAAVQAQVVNAILQSAIGEQIEKAIKEALTKEYGDWGRRYTLVQSSVEQAVGNELRKLATELVESKRDQLKAQLEEKLTDAVLDKMTGAAWALMEGKLKVTD
jgi:hypothetical protein